MILFSLWEKEGGMLLSQEISSQGLEQHLIK